jgi:hypothetical protein
MAGRGTLYDVLGVARSATPDEIRAAYRHAARTLHPDRGGDATAFQRLTLAYHVLADPARRADYDVYVTLTGTPPPATAGGARDGDAPWAGQEPPGGWPAADQPGADRPAAGARPRSTAFPGVSHTARRGYFVMMTVALTLFILAGTVVRPVSVGAAIAMAAVAMVIPPVAAIVANRPPRGAGTAQQPRAHPGHGHRRAAHRP